MSDPPRPSADALLKRLEEQERARLRIYIGAAPGVGKTYEMLREANALRSRGVDVAIGLVETYGRADTEAQINDLEPAQIPERVMVCMSSNPHAPRVIRAGARIAGRLGSKWYAVYVETPHEEPGRIDRADADALRQNIELAERLGAIVVRVRAARPSEGLIAFAQREGVTHVIFGQTARTRWELLLRGSTLDLFLGAVPDAAVQVVPLTETA